MGQCGMGADAPSGRNAPHEVPTYRVDRFRPKEHDWCVGIPVINEGRRIRAQLEEMASCHLGVDVVLADGGSTDGSLDGGFLDGVGVTALLTKTGPGRLSAQLRVLFAWALDEGYRGIITIDGNGKDGLDGIPRVQSALEGGFDFVQGSRFVPGGVADNTPWDRWVGLRLIHAPAISFAARHWYTDTTNGLRGWTAEVLRDPRVAPLRDVFEDYNLHYYLSVRVPRVGYRVTEVPVRRSYPHGVPTPTKIGGLRARWRVVQQLAKAVTHGYDPAEPTGGDVSGSIT